jgi:hypothetical protein
MKKLLVLAVTGALVLSSCSLVGGGSGSAGVSITRVGQTIEVANNTAVDITQSTLVVTGVDDLFIPSIKGDAKTLSKPCRNESPNIWSCNIGVIAANTKKTIDYTSEYRSGSLIAYDKNKKVYTKFF